MPNSDNVFLLGCVQIGQSDATGITTSGWNIYAPVACEIIAVDTHLTANPDSQNNYTVTIYPISAKVGLGQASASVVVASSMYTIASSSYGSYGINTLRRVTELDATIYWTSNSQPAASKHLNIGDGINVAITHTGNASDLTGLVCQVWAVAKR